MEEQKTPFLAFLIVEVVVDFVCVITDNYMPFLWWGILFLSRLVALTVLPRQGFLFSQLFIVIIRRGCGDNNLNRPQ
jgi:hypothetical protein